MRTRLVCLSLVLASTAPDIASAEGLAIGDSAPPIAVSTWVKGEKVERFEPGKTYVVEFWATWCVPCLTSLPHLTELQKKYKNRGVKFIGVSVLEQDQEKVASFVKEMGDRMDFAVAQDDVPRDQRGRPRGGDHGKMVETWLNASGTQGIPTAFIVTDGRIAWIGPAPALDETLEKVVSGAWNIEAAAQKRRNEKDHQSKLTALYQRISEAMRSGETKEVLDAIDSEVAADATSESALGAAKFKLLCLSGRYDEASRYGDRLVTTVVDERASELFIAQTIVYPDKRLDEDKLDLKLARRAAERAIEVFHRESPPLLDILARVYFLSGDPAKAVELQAKAVKLAIEFQEKVAGLAAQKDEVKKARLDRDRKELEAMKGRLAEYTKAAETRDR